MEKDQLLGELASSEMFGPDLKDVKRSGCSVGVVSAPAVPGVLTEATKVAIVGDHTTVLDATTAGKCAGEYLYVYVRLPGAEPMGLHGELSRLGEETAGGMHLFAI